MGTEIYTVSSDHTNSYLRTKVGMVRLGTEHHDNQSMVAVQRPDQRQPVADGAQKANYIGYGLRLTNFGSPGMGIV